MGWYTPWDKKEGGNLTQPRKGNQKRWKQTNKKPEQAVLIRKYKMF